MAAKSLLAQKLATKLSAQSARSSSRSSTSSLVATLVATLARRQAQWVREQRHALLTQNSELRGDGIYAWTLPALAARLDDGTLVKTCPSAGACAALCYARTGMFTFASVQSAHKRKLALVYRDLPRWEREMSAELDDRRYRGKSIRIHDSGDFFSRAYAEAWLRIVAAHPRSTFYAYTKEVALFKLTLAEQLARLPNMHIIYSLGGKQDALIDRDRDRHADVFPTLDALLAAGYADNAASDALAYQSPNHRIGIVANNIAHLRKRQGAHTFAELAANPRLLVAAKPSGKPTTKPTKPRRAA